MAKILYGAPVREEIKQKLIERVKKLAKKPTLAIVQVGNREDSNIYVRNKQKFGEEIGVETKIFRPEFEEEIIGKIRELNEDKNISGIILQLPLPKGFDAEKIINLIKPEKDADGLVGGAVPATARGVMMLLDFYKITVIGKKAAVIGRSKLAGGPIAEMLKKNGAVVTVCNRSTENIAKICRNSDILISAAGQANLVTKDFVNENQVIVDVGINRINGKLIGDVDFTEVESLVTAITPVPGGVGPLTVACLFQNLFDLDCNTM